jgi:hypothetical protein
MEHLEDGDGTGAIVISTGSAKHRKPHVEGVLVSTDNDGLVPKRLVLAFKANCSTQG